MTSEMIQSLLNFLSNEARNAMHVTFGLMEFRPDAASESAWRTTLTAVRSSADRLLSAIDDVRELAGVSKPSSARKEELDFALCVAEICDILNLSSRNGSARLLLERSDVYPRILQDRQTLDQTLTGILKLILRLSKTGIVSVSLFLKEEQVALRIAPRNADVAAKLAEWLNADPDQVSLADQDVEILLLALVAGRRLRAIGGVAEFTCDSLLPTGLTLNLPSHLEKIDQPAGDSAVTARPLRLLVAEDSDESFALTGLLLRSESVERARTGIEAFDMVKQRRFDAVLMDIHMPGMNGYQSIRAIRDWETQSQNAHTPIIILSSDDIEQQAGCAAQCGCSGYLRKPVMPSDLMALLQPLRAIREQEG